MKRSITIRIVRCLAAACLMQGCLLAGSASAGCGDYVMVGGHGEPGFAAARAFERLDDQKPPCHGPTCSRGPDPSPSQPATAAPVQNDWGMVGNGVVVLHVGPTGVVRQERRPKAILGIAHIFRPPRPF
ncbi:MAG TPA: hypothetical protein VF278_20995 [Pirellulales bacterium]